MQLPPLRLLGRHLRRRAHDQCSPSEHKISFCVEASIYYGNGTAAWLKKTFPANTKLTMLKGFDELLVMTMLPPAKVLGIWAIWARNVAMLERGATVNVVVVICPPDES